MDSSNTPAVLGCSFCEGFCVVEEVEEEDSVVCAGSLGVLQATRLNIRSTARNADRNFFIKNVLSADTAINFGVFLNKIISISERYIKPFGINRMEKMMASICGFSIKRGRALSDFGNLSAHGKDF